jgi:hypothetical protein
MTKRRNVIVHNAGRINSRYIKEVPNENVNKLKIGDKVKINKDYLFKSINAMYTLARFYAIKSAHTANGTGNKEEDAKLLITFEKQFR